MPTAFITGITGQDGSYLTELLLNKGYTVHGLLHRPKALPSSPIAHLAKDPNILDNKLFLHAGTLDGDEHFLRRIIHKAKPHEIYHLGGQTRVAQSFQLADQTAASVGMSTAYLLDIAQTMSEPPKFFLASSCEVFGHASGGAQTEDSPLDPVTPYGAAKAYSQNLVKIYRESFNMHACSGILFNHESPRRSEDFVSMKIARGVAKIKLGQQQELHLGSLQAKRDWGWAPDYVEAMWKMLNHEKPEDYVLATGQLHTVQDMVEKAFACVGLKPENHIRQVSALVRKHEHKPTYGDYTKAKKELEWSHTMSFDQMIEALVESQLELFKDA